MGIVTANGGRGLGYVVVALLCQHGCIAPGESFQFIIANARGVEHGLYQQALRRHRVVEPSIQGALQVFFRAPNDRVKVARAEVGFVKCFAEQTQANQVVVGGYPSQVMDRDEWRNTRRRAFDPCAQLGNSLVLVFEYEQYRLCRMLRKSRQGLVNVRL